MSSFGSRPGLNTAAEAATLTALSNLQGGGTGTAIAKNIDGSFSIVAVETPASGITIGTTVLPNGIAGSIIFVGAGAVASQSNSNLFWDNVNQRLGIGTTTPTTALTLNGTMTFTGAGIINTTGATSLALKTNGTTALTLDSSQNAQFAGKVTSYNALTTAGQGTPVIVTKGRMTAQSAAGNITNGAFTVGAADATFEVSGNINVISAVAVSTSINVAYTDETNTSRTLIMPISGLAGSFVAGGLATSAGPFESAVLHIRCKAATTITFSIAAGTFTTVSYNAECVIKQID